MKLFFFLLPVAVLVYVLLEVARVARLVRTGTALARAAHPYTHASGSLSILVLGDSTAVGVGAKEPKESVPGRLGTLLHARVENYAQSGAVVSELQQQLVRAQHERYDLVMIQAGGNDIIKFRPLRGSGDTMDRILSEVESKSDRIILLTAGRIGRAPFFPTLIAPLMTARSLFLRSLFIEIAKRHNVLYVDLLGMSRVFDTEPDRYYAADMLHLSGTGYGVWFEKLETEMRGRWPELFTERV